ncbi:MAG TPA: TIGR04282 family arsenosugar biosynthesis glycosyltransferase [Blastocatellia bacterium]|nr:TIGR04282 family arsenosugar biosynthesis glycosyltransferase [Blastocatellia bacterium]
MATAPREGEVKTQLLGTLSPAEATELYINFLRDTFVLMEEVWSEREELSLILCYTPEGEEEAFECVEREGSMMLAQRGEDLGQRLQHCLADLFELGFDSVVVIGTDSPTLPIDHLMEAFDSLQNEDDLVLGPAADDSYYLVGMRRLHRTILEDLPWGAGGVLAATREQAARAALNLILLPVRYRIETPEELERLRQELSRDRRMAKFTRKFLQTLER